ncbi:hypothetical protein [Azospirillum tabaci]|uniref:hypothetical protein n=1 Tax=Azospirillum tabaci TaxID=2752310 RepID=UPI00166177A2|nr:hypothetical protein [Azospirillum tabaci]
MAVVAQMVGGLVPTFFLRALMLWLLKSWDGGARKLVLANAVSLLIAALVGGMGLADEGAFAPLKAVSVYAIPQALWLAFDLLRLRGKRPELAPGR